MVRKRKIRRRGKENGRKKLRKGKKRKRLLLRDKEKKEMKRNGKKGGRS